MAKINVLDHKAIDRIAAGEVVERPASVVKELVENAIDSGANAVTVEIKEGGISFIRVTDNGCGIEKSQVGNAFLRHATSKISSEEDLANLLSLGFRGEALASIAAVSMVELVSKISGDLTGIRYLIEGGVEKEKEEIGAPDGTTVIVRNLFYNTPPRKKFLKQPQTEGSYVVDLMEHLVMSHPKIAFKFIVNGQNKFYTTGNNDLYEIIYRIYGKELSRELTKFLYEADGMSVSGYLGKPAAVRANRNYEFFYINGRYIRSTLLCKAVEDGYRDYLMQHKFPFCVLHFTIDTSRIDVNVHPAKMEVRIADAPLFYETVKNAVYDALHAQEMIPEVRLTEEKEIKQTVKESVPEPFETRRIAAALSDQTRQTEAPAPAMQMRQTETTAPNIPGISSTQSAAEKQPAIQDMTVSQSVPQDTVLHEPFPYGSGGSGTDCSRGATHPAPEQMTLFDGKILSKESRERCEIIGQLFETYWLVALGDRLLIIDQHAAHEKVKFERFMKRFHEHSIVSQAILPPMIVTLSGKERECYESHAGDFEALGFVIEEFGGNDYAIRGVPMDLYGYEENTFFYEILDELADNPGSGAPESIRTRIATMACKAAVKGNTRISREEMDKLIEELLTLDNPYHCPHGRPTIITISKYELEKKFKRIV